MAGEKPGFVEPVNISEGKPFVTPDDKKAQDEWEEQKARALATGVSLEDVGSHVIGTID